MPFLASCPKTLQPQRLGDQFLSNEGAGKTLAPMGPGTLSSTGVGVSREAPELCQTPVLYWISFSLRAFLHSMMHNDAGNLFKANKYWVNMLTRVIE